MLLRGFSGNPKIKLWTPCLKNIAEPVNRLLPLSFKLQPEWKLRELLATIKEELVDVTDKQNYPLDTILSKYFNSISTFCYDIIVSLENIHEMTFKNKRPFNLLLNFNQAGTEINGEILYNSTLYTQEVITAFQEWLLHIFMLIPEAKITKLSDIDLVRTEELKKLYNPTDLHAVSKSATIEKDTVIGLFQKAANNFPNRVAVKWDDNHLTYKELDRITDIFAHQLLNCQIDPSSLVCILLRPSVEFLVSVLAVLKSGAAYLPIDKDYPVERIKYFINESNSRLLITSPDSQKDFVEITSIYPEIQKLLKKEQFSNNFPLITPDMPVYTIYTSGSTGKPKGTLLTQRSIVNYITWAIQYYTNDLDSADFAFFSSVSFDLTVTSMFMPLLSGSKTIIYRSNEPLLALKDILDTNEVDIIKLTPSHLIYLNEYLRRNYQINRINRLKKIIIGGEQLDTSISFSVSSLMRHHVKLYNEYGPTEATVGCIVHEFNHLKDRGIVVPIGKPISNSMILLVNSENKLLPAGFTGEIVIGGDVLSKGYLNQPELTKEKFIFLPEINEYVYKTGDIANFDKTTGTYTYIGRADKQVKLRGVRIELNEVKYSLLKIPEIDECVVLINEGMLIAFIILNTAIEDEYIVNYLEQILPAFMIPVSFVRINEIPLTPNGKLDEKTLLNQYNKHRSKRERQVLAQTETQKKIAEILSKTLNIQNFNIYDNFFRIGGNSIKMMELNAILESQFNLEIPLIKLFENTCIYDLAKYIDLLKNKAQSETDIADLGVQMKIDKSIPI